MKVYKAVAGPKVINVDKGDSQAAFNSFADIINSNCTGGWEYHSMENITVNEAQGCMKAPIPTTYYMLIFEREQ